MVVRVFEDVFFFFLAVVWFCCVRACSNFFFFLVGNFFFFFWLGTGGAVASVHRGTAFEPHHVTEGRVTTASLKQHVTPAVSGIPQIPVSAVLAVPLTSNAPSLRLPGDSIHGGMNV